MEAKKKRNIKPGFEYDKFFPLPLKEDPTVRRDANVYNTVDFIKKTVRETLDQTKLISKKLKRDSIYETCSNIWHFVYGHISYKKDREGYEQVRNPARAWHDRSDGVDCDCYTVFISSILTNLGIAHTLRITKYHRDHFQHIYPVVPGSATARLQRKRAKEIVIDCVTDKFDYEVPYSEKKDYPMDLQYLNGFDGDDMDELGKILGKNLNAKAKKVAAPLTVKKAKLPAKKAVPTLVSKIRNKVASVSTTTTTTTPPAAAQPSTSAVKDVKKKKGFLKKALNVVNKVNPATVLLRNGILAAMKLNIKNVAARLRWSYLTPAQATAKGIEPGKFQKLVSTRQKLEKIFYGAGGKESNLRKAILSGKGNKDKAVSGLGMLQVTQDISYLNEYSPLEQLLGPEIYYSENIEGMEGFRGFGELGEPVTLTSVGAAMGVIAGIVAALKQVGDIFKSKQPGSSDFDEAKTDAPENNVDLPSSTTVPVATNPILPASPPSTVETKDTANNSNSIINSERDNSNSSYLPTTTSRNDVVTTNDEDINSSSNSSSNITTTDSTNTDDSSGKESFWDKNKNWLKPVAIGVGSLTLIAIGFKMMKGKEHTKSSPHSYGLSGTPKKHGKKNHKRKSKHKNKNHQTKKAIALL